jgi:hypothetical protein
MRERVLRFDIAHVADACALIERHDKRVAGIIGPSHLIEKVKKIGPYQAKTNTLWQIPVVTDDTLEHVFVHD